MRVRCRGHRGGGDGRVMGFCARHDLLTAALLLVARCTYTLRRVSLERGWGGIHACRKTAAAAARTTDRLIHKNGAGCLIACIPRS